jgi:AMP-polyphosphate phosphotransferase
MFESAELGHKIDKETYDAEEPVLRLSLLEAQFTLAKTRDFPVIVLIGGVDGAGKGPTVNVLNAWMDPRLIETNAMGAPSDEEEDRPRMWRFWRALPPAGKIGIFFGSWYSQPILNRVYGETGASDLEKSIEEIERFEAMLAAEGALILKFWFHLSKKAQKKRLKALEKDSVNHWRVQDTDWERFEMYDRFRKISELTLRRTSKGHAPWHVVEGGDERYRNLTVGRTLLAALRERLDGVQPEPAAAAAPPPLPSVDGRNVIDALDLSLALKKKEYEERLAELQGRFNGLSRHKKFARHALVAVFEGNDAAGKGGAIRRMTGALDARFFRVVPVAAPTEEERLHPYLWRFWRHIPRRGNCVIFDRSWYGRVLVERVEELSPEDAWMRAYGEINDFEEELARHGCILAKFWLAIDRNEQEARFRARQDTGYKRFKLTPDDWRNRDKWDLYVHAVSDMVDRTSTSVAPWTLVEANDKYHARIKVLETLCERIEAAF